MNDFLQMDIFFFIASVASVVALLLLVVVGTYAYVTVRKVHAIVHEIRLFIQHASEQGKLSIEVIRERIEGMIADGGVTERIVATALGTILAKTFKGRGKIRKDAPKKRTR